MKKINSDIYINSYKIDSNLIPCATSISNKNVSFSLNSENEVFYLKLLRAGFYIFSFTVNKDFVFDNYFYLEKNKNFETIKNLKMIETELNETEKRITLMFFNNNYLKNTSLFFAAKITVETKLHKNGVDSSFCSLEFKNLSLVYFKLDSEIISKSFDGEININSVTFENNKKQINFSPSIEENFLCYLIVYEEQFRLFFLDFFITQETTKLEMLKNKEDYKLFYLTKPENDFDIYVNKSISDILDNTTEVELLYNNNTPSVIEVGGIKTGTTFNNIKFSEFVDMLLYPELFPNISPPYCSFNSNNTGLKEVGVALDIVFSASFNRGSISPKYESSSGYRAGLPSSYVYSGDSLSEVETESLSDSQSISNYIVVLGNQSWSCYVSYLDGVQPKGSKGNDFNTPLPAGQTNIITRTITGVYPIFATSSAIEDVSKQTLSYHGSQKIIELSAEDGLNKQSVEFPLLYGTLSLIEQYNTLSGSWDSIALDTFDVTVITKNINSNDIAYNKYTYNGSTIGLRKLRFTF